MSKNIEAHIFVKNESRFVWYSIMSIYSYVDKINIWDTGSTDNTRLIIKEVLNLPESHGKVSYEDTHLEKFDEKFARGKMLKESTADWIFIVDADEIWWDDSVKLIRKTIEENSDQIESIIVPTFNMVGDMFHYQEQMAGRYNLAGRTGHYGLRLFSNKIPGLHTEGDHGVFGWVDDKGQRIENRDPKKIKYIDAPYIHTTHLLRSDKIESDENVYKRNRKFKYENGIKVPLDFYYPEVFFKSRPKIVPSVWKTPSLNFKLRAFIETPIRKVYRRTLMKNKKHGY